MYGSPQVTAVAANYEQSSVPAAVKGATNQSEQVAKIGLLSSGQSSWATFVVMSIASVAAVAFVLRHGLLLRRSLVMSEAFVLHHPLLDMVLLMVVMGGFVLTRTAGFVL
jgi:hypothetical protein